MIQGEGALTDGQGHGERLLLPSDGQGDGVARTVFCNNLTRLVFALHFLIIDVREDIADTQIGLGGGTVVKNARD